MWRSCARLRWVYKANLCVVGITYNHRLHLRFKTPEYALHLKRSARIRIHNFILSAKNAIEKTLSRSNLPPSHCSTAMSPSTSAECASTSKSYHANTTSASGQQTTTVEAASPETFAGRPAPNHMVHSTPLKLNQAGPTLPGRSSWMSTPP